MKDIDKKIQMDDMYNRYGNRSIYNPDGWGSNVDPKELRDTAQMTDDEFNEYMYSNYPYDPEYAIDGREDWSSVPFGDYSSGSVSEGVSGKIRLSEGILRRIIRESLNEMNWTTAMKASKKRKSQADDIRSTYAKSFPNSDLSTSRNKYDDKSDALETHAQKMFNLKHNNELLDHGSERDGYWNGEKAHISHRRSGSGIPYRSHGYVYDETFDDAVGDGFTGNEHRRHATRVDSNGAKWDPDKSTSNAISYSKSGGYNRALDGMVDDMKNYYMGLNESKIDNIIMNSIKNNIG